jgi:hypothetical protein
MSCEATVGPCQDTHLGRYVLSKQEVLLDALIHGLRRLLEHLLNPLPSDSEIFVR